MPVCEMGALYGLCEQSMNLMSAPRQVLYEVKCDQSPGVDPQRAAPKGQVVEPPLGGQGPPGETHAPPEPGPESLTLHFGEAVLWPVGHLGLTG